MRFVVIAAIAVAPFLYALETATAPADAAATPADAAKPPADGTKPAADPGKGEGGAGAGQTPAGDSVVTNVRVGDRAKKSAKFLEEEGSSVVQLGDDVVVRVTQWEKLMAKARAAQKPVTLYINGLDSRLEPVTILGGKDTDVTFRLARNDTNKELWRGVLRDPTEGDKKLHLSVGVSGSGQPLLLDPTAPNGSVMLDKITLAGVGIFWLIMILLIAGGLLFLCVTTDVLRNGPEQGGKQQPYSLARTQMAWWFLLIILAYILIWTFTGERDTIPASLLALLGISAATAMGSVMIDSSKEQRNASATRDLQAQKESLDATVPATSSARAAVDKRITDINATITMRNEPKKKDSFLMDLLTDDNGQIALHRYQIAGWTIVLGLVFVGSVIRDLSMPELNGTLLALMGISSGTYLGFKMPG